MAVVQMGRSLAPSAVEMILLRPQKFVKAHVQITDHVRLLLGANASAGQMQLIHILRDTVRPRGLQCVQNSLVKGTLTAQKAEQIVRATRSPDTARQFRSVRVTAPAVAMIMAPVTQSSRVQKNASVGVTHAQVHAPNARALLKLVTQRVTLVNAGTTATA